LPVTGRYDFLMDGLSHKQAAELAGVSEDIIGYWIKRGLLRAARKRAVNTLKPEEVLAAKQLAYVGDVVPLWRNNRAYAGQRLRTLREAAGLTQLQLSARSGVTHEALSHLERGTRTASAHTVHQLSQALGIPPQRFVDDAPIGLELLTTEEAGRRLDVPAARIQYWLKHGVLPATKVGGQWRVPAIAVAELDRSGRLRGASRRLDPRYRG
jgi:excisionase family DNA binding protein